MRRFLFAAASMSLLSAVLGCNHTAGVCDCDDGSCGGNGHGSTLAPIAPGGAMPGAMPGAIAPAPIVQPEGLKVMPKEGAAKPADALGDKPIAGEREIAPEREIKIEN